MKKEMLYDINNEPLVISKSIIDLFLKEEKPADLIALYTFYYYTAKWQRTNQPKATTNFTAKGLHWGDDKVIDRKKILIKLNLIENVMKKDKKTGKIIGNYIKVNFIWGKSKSREITEVTTVGETPRAVNNAPNPLNTNNTNPLSTVRTTTCELNNSPLNNFSSKEYINQLIGSNKKHISLIGKYFKEKRMEFPSLKAAQAELVRWTKDASILTEYSDERINNAFSTVQDKFPNDWKLSTMLKYIN